MENKKQEHYKKLPNEETQQNTELQNEEIQQNTELQNKKTKQNTELQNKENERNIEQHHDGGNKQFTCDECGNSYARKRRLTEHMLKHVATNQKTFKCEPCGKTFPLERDLKKHNKRKHAGSEGFNYGNCEYSFRTCEQLEEHELIHKFNIGLKLKETSRIAEQAQNYEMQNREDDEYLLQQFDVQNAMDHPFECIYCGKMFSEIDQLKNHKKRTHQKEKLSNLNVSFTGIDALSEDEITHPAQNVESGNGEDNEMQQCDHCGNFFLKSLLTDHLLTHTSDDSDFKCVPCGKSFLFKTCIIKHNKNVHGLKWDGKDGFYMPKPEERTQREIIRKRYIPLDGYEAPSEDRFVCEQCNESFSDISTLRRHMLTHKLLKCDLCEIRGVKAKFATIDALEVHKLSHSNKNVKMKGEGIGSGIGVQNNGEGNVKKKMDRQERNTRFQIDKQTTECLFYCDECHMPFQNSSSLKEHKETHKLFECKDCYYKSITARFKSIEELDEHKLKHNRNLQRRMPEWNVRTNNERYRTNKMDWRVQIINKKPAEYRFDNNQYQPSSASYFKMGKNRDYRLEYDQCGKADASNFSFKEHQNLQDKGAKYFPCHQCKVWFSRRDTFEEHRLLHTDMNFQLQNKKQKQKFRLPKEEQVVYPELQNEEQVPNQNEKEVQNADLQKEEGVQNLKPQNIDQEQGAMIRRKERNWNLSVRSKEKSGNFSSKSQ